MKIIQMVSVCAALVAFATPAVFAQPAIQGSIAGIDEPAGTISIQKTLSGAVGANGVATTDSYKVEDGLIFNAVRYGDKVMFSAETIDGAKTITQLQKE
jgi:Cu/Ag efflux protein CusF